MLGVMISWLILSFFAGFIRKRTAVGRDYRDVTVALAGEHFHFKALIDTANFLREPVSGKPVAVICRSAAGDLWQSCPDDRFCLIPFKGIGAEGGLMQGFRADLAVIGEMKIERPVFAIYEGEFGRMEGEEAYQILLHRELMEGGIAVNV